MSRRKQSRPRPVKGPTDWTEDGSHDVLTADVTRSQIVEDEADEDDVPLANDKLIIALSPARDEDNDDDDDENKEKEEKSQSRSGSGSTPASASSAPKTGPSEDDSAVKDQSATSTTMNNAMLSGSLFPYFPPSSHIPPNFLLHSPSSPFAPPPSHFSVVQPPQHLTFDPSRFHQADLMARKKRSPHPSSTAASLRRWAPNSYHSTRDRSVGGVLSDNETIKCEICCKQTAKERAVLTPRENQDYYIETDGNLTVKNGICTRRLILTIFSDVWETPGKYRRMLGENFPKFLLNLDQILRAQPQTACPDESSLQAITVQSVLMHHLGQHRGGRQNVMEKQHNVDKLSERLADTQRSLLHNRKRHHDQISIDQSSESDRRSSSLKEFPKLELLMKTRQEEEEQRKKKLSINDPVVLDDDDDDDRDQSPPPSSLPENFLRLSTPSKSKSSQNKSNPPNLPIETDNFSIDGHGSMAMSETGSVTGGSSRAGSPTPSQDSFSHLEGAKQMANTKRGSKILPVASVNGETHYICPVCSLELSSDHELTIHIRSHNQSTQQTLPNTCTICHKTLSSQSSLDRHMLVHSGERPFKCTICDMSFTTNGNMHRHSRIHQKNGISVPNTPRSSASVRKPVEPKQTKKDNLLYDKMAAASKRPMSNQSQYGSVMSDYTEKSRAEQDRTSADLIQQYYNDLNKLKAMGMGHMLFPFNAHPAFPYPPMFSPDQARMLSYMQGMIDPMTGELLAKRARMAMTPARPPSPDLRTAQIFRCRECGDEFHTQFALDAHLESHVIVDKEMEKESGTACKKCGTVAKSEESLLLHMLTNHKKADVPAIPDTRSNPPSPTNSSGSQKGAGFQELGFASFTDKKFPLIAKAFCETLDDPKGKGQKSPVFQCSKCDKKFPVEGARDLHEVCHLPGEYTVCPCCDCHFTDSTRLQQHMQKHVSDSKFEQYLSQSKGKDTEMSEIMGQNYFLVQLGLVPKESDGMDEDNMIVVGKDEIPMEKDDIVVKKEEQDTSSEADEASKDSMKSKDQTSYFEQEARSILTLPASTKSLDLALSNKKSQLSAESVPKSLLQVSEASNDSIQSGLSHSDSVSNVKMTLSNFLSDGKRTSALSADDDSSILPPIFPCKLCDKFFTSAKDLEAHQQSHRNHFECQVCSYSSTDRSTLLRHMRTHSGERPFKCAKCDYSFTTKANCERHLRQKHNINKDDVSKYVTSNTFLISNHSQSAPTTPTGKTSNTPSGDDLTCQSCGKDFYNQRTLIQHLQLSPQCRTGYHQCNLCGVICPTKSAMLLHMHRQHSDLSGASFEKMISSLADDLGFPTPESDRISLPPPAHVKTGPISPALSQKSGDEKLGRFKESPSPLFKSTNSLVAKRFNFDSDTDMPLDFSKQQGKSLSSQLPLLSPPLSVASSPGCVESSPDDQPIDLSITSSRRSSTSSSSSLATTPLRSTALGPNPSPFNQRLHGAQRRLKEEITSSCLTQRDAKLVQSNKHTTSPRPGVDTPTQRSDGNNNKVSPTLSPSPSGKGVSPLLSNPFPVKQEPDTSPSKHPAFPQLLNMMPGYQIMPGTQTLAFQNHPMLSQQLAIMSSGHQSSSLSEAAAKDEVSTKLTPRFEEILKTQIKSSDSPKKLRESTKRTEKDDLDLRIQPHVVLEDINKDKKLKTSKGSSSESDSSCELASVNKILDATDAQNFQEFLMIPETEDEQDMKSESVPSGEESNQSLEHMFTQSMSGGRMITRKERAPSRNEEVDSLKEDESGDKQVEDPSNMSEAAIAKLIQKVSNESVNSQGLLKRKRNSYADSPHKFTCPYCPRCFPWLSSLNRHLLTHTGQKPFKCPRCPVTFSTKSNRERHLIRKHNVNMLDPASRAMMDRPYKCHLCVFSSFSTQSNLIKHYKDRHDGMSPPPQILEMGDKSDGEDSSGGGNGSSVGASYEDEEEYNLAEMRSNGLSDKELMFQNYAQDSDSNHGNSNGSTPTPTPTRDPHKKRNTIFNLASDEEVKLFSSSSKGRSSPSSSTAGGSLAINRPGVDDTVLTDTMKQFLDTSVRQALEDSHRRAMKEGVPFVITPAMERQLRKLSKSQGQFLLEDFKKGGSEEEGEPVSKQVKTTSTELPFPCHLCSKTFPSRVECLEHQSQTHPESWATLKERNAIGNVQVHATRLDKMIEKLCKKGRESSAAKSDGDAEGKAEPSKPDDPKTKDSEDNKVSKESSDPMQALQAMTSIDYIQRRVHCSLCPKKFWSIRELQIHMLKHSGDLEEPSVQKDKGQTEVTSEEEDEPILEIAAKTRSSRQTRASVGFKPSEESSQSRTSSGSSSALNKTKTSSSFKTKSSSSKVKGDKMENTKTDDADDDSEEDMLHNLLGVESSTIDQIIEAQDSAATLLGFKDEQNKS